MAIKLIAFDLDGTLLDGKKEIPPENMEALNKAAQAGIWLVPATGRIYTGIPAPLREAPWARYFITANGASTYDALEDREIAQAQLDVPSCLDLIAYLDGLPVIYDCYQDNWGFISASMLDKAGDYLQDPGILKMMYDLRTPVPNLAEYLREKGRPVQKLQAHFRDMELRSRELEEIPRRFPQTAVSSSLSWNIEINSVRATKGQALAQLCRLLDIDPADTITFGDGSNDLDMICISGHGVALGNAVEPLKAAAAWIAPSNENAGLAAGIRHFTAGQISW